MLSLFRRHHPRNAEDDAALQAQPSQGISQDPGNDGMGMGFNQPPSFPAEATTTMISNGEPKKQRRANLLFWPMRLRRSGISEYSEPSAVDARKGRTQEETVFIEPLVCQPASAQQSTFPPIESMLRSEASQELKDSADSKSNAGSPPAPLSCQAQESSPSAPSSSAPSLTAPSPASESDSSGSGVCLSSGWSREGDSPRETSASYCVPQISEPRWGSKAVEASQSHEARLENENQGVKADEPLMSSLNRKIAWESSTRSDEKIGSNDGERGHQVVDWERGSTESAPDGRLNLETSSDLGQEGESTSQFAGRFTSDSGGFAPGSRSPDIGGSALSSATQAGFVEEQWPPSAPAVSDATKVRHPPGREAAGHEIFHALPMLRGEKLSDFLSDWMRHPVIQESRIWDISIPGTHNSATWEVSEKGRTLQGFASMFVKCQERSIYQQLESGVRFFDLRVLKDGGPTGLLSPWCAHGSFKTIELTQVYTELAEFLTSHSKEVVLLSVRRDQGITTGPNSMALVESDFWIALFLGKFLGPKLQSKTTVKELGARGQQVIYFFEEVERYLPSQSFPAGDPSPTAASALQPSQSVTLSRLDSIFNAPRLPRKLQLVPLAPIPAGFLSSAALTKAVKGMKNEFSDDDGGEAAYSPQPRSSQGSDKLSRSAAAGGERQRPQNQYISDFRREQDEDDDEGGQGRSSDNGVVSRLQGHEGHSDTEINTKHSKALKQLRSAKLKGRAPGPGKMKQVNQKTLIVSKFIENLEKGLKYMVSEPPSHRHPLIASLAEEEPEVGEEGSHGRSDALPTHPGRYVSRRIASMAGANDGFEIAWKCGTLRLLPPDWDAQAKGQRLIPQGTPRSGRAKKEAADVPEDYLRSEVGGYFVNSTVVKLHQEDVKRFRAMKLTREFFLQPLEGRIVDEFVFISPFLTGRTIIQKSWSQTCDNNPKFLLKKLKYWVNQHGTTPPRMPYRFRVLAAEVTPPAPEIALGRTEMMKFWTGQGLSAAFRLPAGLKPFAQATNKLVIKDVLSPELVFRLNVITHDFCSSRFILTVLYLYFRANLTISGPPALPRLSGVSPHRRIHLAEHQADEDKRLIPAENRANFLNVLAHEPSPELIEEDDNENDKSQNVSD